MDQPVPRVPQLSLHTPLGALTLSEDDGALVALDWGWGRDQQPSPLLNHARTLLQAYLDGEPVDFTPLPLRPQGTPYQRRVWTGLAAIPRGQTRTYAALARTVGGSPRSIGHANGRNPLPILIPCHRVLATGGIGGYSGHGGLETKAFLLRLEGGAA